MCGVCVHVWCVHVWCVHVWCVCACVCVLHAGVCCMRVCVFACVCAGVWICGVCVCVVCLFKLNCLQFCVIPQYN